MPPAHIAIWSIFALSIACMLLRPRNIPEVWWISAGAGSLVAFGLLPLRSAGHAIAQGTNVYLFLTGMMLICELARRYGVFDWLAALAITHSDSSRARLLALVYGVGAVVTIFMSNDATAVVLTPAVLAAVKKQKGDPLPYLFACAFVANAASFVLPISNPANLVVFQHGMPPLSEWVAMFAIPSVLAIAGTYALLHWRFREELREAMDESSETAHLSATGKVTLASIFVMAAALLVASELKMDLGLPAFATAVAAATVLLLWQRTNPWHIAREISWSVLPLVAGLFMLVQAVRLANALVWTEAALHTLEGWHPIPASLTAAFSIGIGTNLLNNLPLGLLMGEGVQATLITGALRHAVLIAIDLGPNLSVTGSLATILWLIAIRKEGLDVSAWKFLKIGALVMPPTLLLAALTDHLIGR